MENKPRQNIFSVYSLVPLIFMFTGWFLLTKGALWSWLIGVPAILLAYIVYGSLPVLQSFKLSAAAVVPFLVYFIKQSLLGGIDVALRSFQKDMKISATFIDYPFRITNQIARLFFANTLSLLPGTLSADLEEDKALIHLLDQKLDNVEHLKVLEMKVATLFGEKI